MKMYFRVRFIALVAVVPLGSCISVTTGSYQPPANSAMQRQADEIVQHAERIAQQDAQSNPVATIEAHGSICPMYKLPALPARPKKPIKEIQALQEGDDDKLDQIAQNYTHALERYNLVVATLIQKSYADYLAKCAKNLAQPSPPASPASSASTP